MSRQKTPDIMATVMNGNAAIIDVEQESNKEINTHSNTDVEKTSKRFQSESNKTINIPKNKAIKQDSGKEIIEMKEKATFNLSLRSLEALEDAWIKLKREFKGEQRVTKTAIVEMALEICIGEFNEDNSKSTLYRKLAEFRNNINLNDNITT